MPCGENVLPVHDALIAEAAVIELAPANKAAATTKVLRNVDMGEAPKNRFLGLNDDRAVRGVQRVHA
jgi:hypothetical protein